MKSEIGFVLKRDVESGMKKWLKRIAFGLVAILLVVLVFLIYAMRPLPVPAKSNFAVTLSNLRTLADKIKGPKPLEIRTASSFQIKMPHMVVGTGKTWGMNLMEGWTYQIVFPKKRIMVDVAMGKKALGEKMPGGIFHAKAHANLQKSMLQSDAILLTHEHFDHAGGIPSSPYLKQIAAKVYVTPEQLDNPLARDAGLTAELSKSFKKIKYKKLHAFMPGVVLIKAPGHTPGSQMFYIKLQNGSEYLLVGDVAWNEKNITLPRGHARLVHWMINEDGKALGHQLRFLYNLHRNHPKVHLIVSHDYEGGLRWIKKGALKKGFLIK